MSDEAKRREALLERWKREHPNPTPAQVIGLLHQLGRPPDIHAPEFDPNNIRCACNKDVPCERAKLVNTGYMDAVEPICPPCRKDFDGQARLVCIPCRSVIGWLKPQTDKFGFKFEKDKFYHVERCPVCRPGTEQANIIELMLYYDEIGVPYEKPEIKDWL